MRGELNRVPAGGEAAVGKGSERRSAVRCLCGVCAVAALGWKHRKSAGAGLYKAHASSSRKAERGIWAGDECRGRQGSKLPGKKKKKKPAKTQHVY